ncbi:MAG: hypothetical protein E7294_00740 [Lachnospiraceae bacterium]|nr:hypothetical protein [Lachnospiraceae bacterium]
MELGDKMVTQEKIGYEIELQENISIDSLREQYQNGIIIWLTGSGPSPDRKSGCYRLVLDFAGHTKYMEKELPGKTANQTMILGAIDAVECVNKPFRLYIVSATALGFAGAFRGKGVNSSLLQELLFLIEQKACYLTEVQFYNGADLIKQFIRSCNPNKTTVKKKDYKQLIYEECLGKVERLLVQENVSREVIDRIRNIKP